LNLQSVVPESDHDLLHALARGEPHAVATLYQRHGARMVAFARRYVKDYGAAEDVVIGLLGRWLERPPRVREVERAPAFLATSVYHAAVDWIRRERAEQGQPPRIRGDEFSPRAPVAREDMRGRLSAALERLSAGERLLLESHYGRALTTEESMEQLGISRPAFHQRLHRARVHLAALLAEEVRA
jgi:RNA polymerase sigma factor (sigma-70 family)